MEPDENDKTVFLGPRAGGASGAPAPPRLIVIEGAGRGLVVDVVKPTLTVGRREDNDVVLPSSAVSKHHARITRDGDRLLIEDLQSTNGVYVNGAKLGPAEPRALFHGDKIGVSDHQILFLNEAGCGGGAGDGIAVDRERVSKEADALFAELFGA